MSTKAQRDAANWAAIQRHFAQKTRKNPLAGVSGTVNASGGKPAPPRRGKKNPLAGVSGTVNAAARPKPPSNIVESGISTIVGTQQGLRRSVRRRESPAQTQKTIERNIAQVRRRRAVKEYTDLPRAQRAKVAAAAQRRVEAGRGSERDVLVVQTHQARTRNDSARSDKAVRDANARHDRAASAARGRQLQDLIAGIGPQERSDRAQEADQAKVDSRKSKDEGILAGVLDDVKSAPADLVKGTRANVASAVKGAADATNAVANAAIKVTEFNPLHTGGGSRKYTEAGLDPGGAVKAAVAAPKVLANVARVSADDPSQLPRAVKDAASMIKDLPAGVVAAAKDPGGAASATVKDFKRRYGPLLEGKDKEFRERLKKEGIAPEVIDSLGLLSGESAGAARATSAVAKGVARTTRAGTRLNRTANRVVRGINDPRPDLAIGDGKSIPQRKSKGLVGVTANRVLDSQRAKRVIRQVEAKGDKARLGEAPATGRRSQQRVNQRGRVNYGRGVRGVLPQDGQVAHLTAGRGGLLDRQAAAQRKHLSKLTGTASRRVNRVADDHARPAEAALSKLLPEERRAARPALEGRLTLTDPEVTVQQVDRMIASIRAQRRELEAKPKKAREYTGLIGDQTDNLKSLQQLRTDLIERPEKVLTKRLRALVEDERGRRPQFEEMASDVLSPVTMKRRRVDPAAVQFGTFEQHAAERHAVDALRAADGDVQKAVAQIVKKRDKASATSTAGKAKRRELGRNLRTLERLAEGLAPKLGAGQLDELEANLVDAHFNRTAQAAHAAGVEEFDPVYFGHRRTDDGGLGEFTAGSGSKGKVSGFKRSEMRLHQLGFVDETPGGYAIAKQQAGKRAAQWQMVDEIAQDFVPRWARGDDGKGITRKEFDSYVRKHGLDPQDWALWQSKASMGPESRGSIADEDMGVSLADVERLGDQAPAWTRGRFHVIPKNVLDDMNQVSGRAARTAQRIAGGTSGAILGSNPFYAIRQALQTTPLTLIHTAPGFHGLGFLDPAVIRNFRAMRKAEKNNPRVMRDLHDRFGTRSRMKDFTEAPRMGALARDQKRWAAGIDYDQRILFGVDWNRLLEERRSVGPKGSTSIAVRTLAKRNPVSLVMRASRDFNVAIDAWQDRLQRTFVLAFEDAKLSKQGIRDDFPQIAARDAGDVARKLGPIAAASQLPWDQYKTLDRSPEYRHVVEEAGDAMVRWLGDYANYSKAEQRYARSFFMFYGFVRHSSRLLLTTMPLEHPLMFAAVLQQGRIASEERQQLIDEFAKRHLLTPEMARGLVAISDGDKLKTIDTKWMNPILGPLMDIGTNGITGQLPIPTPYVAAVESRLGVSDFTGSPLTNEKGPAIYGNELTGVDRGRVFANRMLSMLYPVRVLDVALNGDQGKMADTSIPLLDPQPIKYKAGGDADVRNQQRIQESRALGPLLRAAQSGVPLFPKSGTALLNSAEYETDKDNPKAKKKRKAPAAGGAFGSGSFGGGSSFGGGGGF